ncbi:MAG: type I restriction endonuclease subunit M [Comamonadaceae bacterium]|nr:type I restriction endonuclease subunit M [Comamonadaceae bacterium]
MINIAPEYPLFSLGKLVATPGAIELLKQHELSPFDYVSRHWQGDWGDLYAEDVEANQAALRYGTRLVSSYRIGDHDKLWVITEADRSSTTLLLPSEY